MTVAPPRVNMRAASIVALAGGIALSFASPAGADLAAPAWYDENAVGTAPDWHYRVPVVLPAGAGVSSTVRVDVDFRRLLRSLRIRSNRVDFDESSVRVVRPNGALVDEQEFTDIVWQGELDAAGNRRGEVRFILMDPPSAGTYWIYFDIVENGAKGPNPAAPVNGTFENSNGAVPTSWTTGAINANGNEERRVVDSNRGDRINLPAQCAVQAANGVDNGPNESGNIPTGRSWMLLGYRENCEDGLSGTTEQVYLERTLSIPALSPGELSFFLQVQGYDGINTAGTNYDFFRLTVNGTPVDHTQLDISTASPALRILGSMLGRAGYSTSFLDHGWRRARLDLSAYAGQTVTLRFATHHSAADNQYTSWVKLDDVEWSVQAATVGAPEGFGANIVVPNDTAGGSPVSVLGVGQTVSLRVELDAQATRPADPVLVDIEDALGNTVATDIPLFDDGTRGDATANDGVWSNDGSDSGAPTYTILATDPMGPGWTVRVFAFDAGDSRGGAPDGLIAIPGRPRAPYVQANYWNIDEQRFEVGAAPDLLVMKQSAAIYDPHNLAVNPKSIPGGHVRYTLSVSNAGPGSVDSDTIDLRDRLNPDTALCVSPICASGSTPVAFDTTATPTPTGLTFDYATDVSFSTNGTDYTYVPVPDPDGFDPNVRYVRVAPKGAFSGSAVTGDPRFDVHFVVRVD